MDCIHARLVMVLHDREPVELDAAAQAALEQHLERCAACLAWSHQESRVDETLGRAIQAVPVPADLPSKILHQLEQQRRPRRLPWLAAAAACLLLGLSGGGYVWYTDRPMLTLDNFVETVSLEESASAKGVEDWFAYRGMAVEVPVQFINFDNCNGYLIADVQGHRLPRLDFLFRGNGETQGAVAHVYVLDKNRFRVDEIVKAIDNKVGPFVTSGHRIEALKFDNEYPNFVYVIVYTGGSLQPFLLAARSV